MARQENPPAGCSKTLDFSPAQPWRAETLLVPGKAAASDHLLPSLRGGWDDSNCAQHSHPPTHWHAETCHYPGRGPLNPFYVSLREWSRLPLTARIERYTCSLQACSFHFPRNGTRVGPTAAVERAHSDRARSGSKGSARVSFHLFHRGGSASKKGTWPLPFHPSQAARCASTGIAYPSSPPPHPREQLHQ